MIRMLCALFALTFCTATLSACAVLPEDRGPTAVAGAAGGFSDVQTPDGERGAQAIPPDVMTIPSLPVPDGAQVLLSDTVIVGGDEDWTGQVVMAADGYTIVQMVEFIRKEMPSFGWDETTIVRSRRTSITYVQGERVATIRIMPTNAGTEIDVVVAPIRPRAD